MEPMININTTLKTNLDFLFDMMILWVAQLLLLWYIRRFPIRAYIVECFGYIFLILAHVEPKDIGITTKSFTTLVRVS
jgi:hypothetical protein